MLLRKNILPIRGVYIFQLLIFVFKSLNNIGHNTVTFPKNQNKFNTGNSSNLRVSSYRLETTKQKIEYIGGIEFNKLPTDLKSIQRISLFKTNLKNIYIAKS